MDEMICWICWVSEEEKSFEFGERGRASLKLIC